MTRFDDAYDTVIHFPGSTGPPVSIRTTIKAFEQTLAVLGDSSVDAILEDGAGVREGHAGAA